MTLLLLETATTVCSVALVRDGRIISELHSDEPNAHLSRLACFIQQICDDNGIALRDLDGVCVSSGPGSYTGLRIGVSSAKGICYALGVPLIAVPTLQSMAAGYYDAHPDYDGLVCPMIDARRMECYTAIFDRQGQLRDTEAQVIEPDTFDAWLAGNTLTFIGDGAAKTQPLLAGKEGVRYDTDYRLSATGMAHLAVQRLANGQTEDVAYFEPFYLKDFVAKKSTVHGLRS